ncbi:hypothetical protein SALBM311S_06521 [Streptomyces alboniger]
MKVSFLPSVKVSSALSPVFRCCLSASLSVTASPSVPRARREPSTSPRSKALQRDRVGDGQRPSPAVDFGDPAAESDGRVHLGQPLDRPGEPGLMWPPAPNEGVLTATSPAKDRDTVWSMVAFSEAPNTVNSDTTATPIISAPAVAAVRLGLRRALRRASPPGTPRSLSRGPPRTRTAVVEATGPRTTKEARARTAPVPASQKGRRDQNAGEGHGDREGGQTHAGDGTDAGAPEEVDRGLAQGGQRRGAAGMIGRQQGGAQQTTVTASGRTIDRELITSFPRGRGIRSPGRAPAARPRAPMPPARPTADAITATALASTRVTAVT